MLNFFKKKVVQENIDPQIQQEKMKYLALQNQINPHFLYNTLENIRSEALIGDREIAAKMAELLGSYFRYSISNMDKLVKVEDEIESVHKYFAIQKFRFEDRIEIYIEYDDHSINQLKMPKLILQPIVENSILHGIEPSLKKGIINISLKLYDTHLLICVSDTGIGIDKSKLDDIQQKLSQPSPNQFDESIGIINVNHRLKMLYGNDYGLKYFSKKTIGTDVEIKIPYENNNIAN